MENLIEPVPVDDDLCTGLALIEDVEFGGRFVLYTQQTCYESASTVLVVKRKIVLPLSAIVPSIEMARRFVARRTAGPSERLLRLVR